MAKDDKDERRTLIGVRLPVTMVRALKLEAIDRDSSVQAIVELAVRKYFGRRLTQRRGL